ncbi:hypothetical protein [Gemella morbillorum]|uniref:hypothetical protein n=1 Tax=Gemella morbillorum TaxID=29391 RepID=UPI00319E1692
MKIEQYKNEIKTEELYLLEELANEIINKENTNEVTLETLLHDNTLLLSFVKTYLTIAPTLKYMVEECQKIKDSETFRNKIIDREIGILTKYQEILEVGKIIDRPTDLEILKIQTQSAFETTVKILEKLKDTYKKDETTLRIEV